ncbi:hypothetical protein EMGBS4_19530 [Acidimicrobiaceae bacterium]|nr:hypothetical protein EMGBS4_19530 [Acidimicrobiaceae bacterium]
MADEEEIEIEEVEEVAGDDLEGRRLDRDRDPDFDPMLTQSMVKILIRTRWSLVTWLLI